MVKKATEEAQETKSKKTDLIQFRISSGIKEAFNKYVADHIKYDNVAEMARSVLLDYITGKLVYKAHEQQVKIIEKSSELGDTIKFLEKIEKIQKTMDSQKEQLHMISSYVLNGQKTFPSKPIETMEKNNIESEIINLLEINPLTSEQLAKAFKIKENRILRFLNKMVKEHTLGFNDKMEYVFVEKREIKDTTWLIDSFRVDE